jgi:hypothetical protein
MKWMEFGCETLLLAEMPEMRQHFFLFFPDLLFFTRGFNPTTALAAKAGGGARFN